LKTTIWLILGLLIVAVAGMAAFFPDFNSNTINILIYTNGSSTDVNTQGIVYGTLPAGMMNEIKNKASIDVLSENSTDSSIKSDVKTILSKYNYNANIKIVSQFGTDQLPMLATVKGTSMVPTLIDGQNIVVLKTKDFKVGDIVVAIHPTYGLIVKRLSIIQGNQVYLTSDNKNVEVVNTKTKLLNGSVEKVTVQKTPLNTWLPIDNVIGVVKDY
jgi:signal peptidase I